jgi:hypothetical protein
MDEINQQLQELKLQEHELHKQKLLLEKQQHEEEIKRIESTLRNPIQETPDINALTQLLMNQQKRIEQLEKGGTPVRRRTTVPKVPPSQRPRRRTREPNYNNSSNNKSPDNNSSNNKSPELKKDSEFEKIPWGSGFKHVYTGDKTTSVPPKPTRNKTPGPVKTTPAPELNKVPNHIVIEMSEISEQDLHNTMHSELLDGFDYEDPWTEIDDEKQRINQLMFGELSAADIHQLNTDDKLYQDYIKGDYTPDSYTPSSTASRQSAMADHMRRRQKGTRWRPEESDVNGLASAQSNLHKRLWERAESEDSSEDLQFFAVPGRQHSPVDTMTDATKRGDQGFLLRHKNAE